MRVILHSIRLICAAFSLLRVWLPVFEERTMRTRILATGTVALLGLIAATDVSAATGEDRWLPYQGCWRAENAPSSNLLCIVADGAGVRMIELADGAIARETRITADGTPRAVSQEGCTGTEKARWSADGRRLY